MDKSKKLAGKLIDRVDRKSLDTDAENFVVGLEQWLEEFFTERSDESASKMKKEFDEKLLKVLGKMEKDMPRSAYNPMGDIINKKGAELSALRTNKQGNLVIATKAAETITVGGLTASLPVPQMLPGVNAIVHPETVLGYISSQNITNPIVSIVNEKAGEGDFGWTAEGTLKPKMDFDFDTQEFKAKKLASHAKMSKEMLDDIPFIQSETQRIMREKFERKLSAAVFSGDGTGENIFGVTYFASPYTQTCINGKIEGPGVSEVLFASATQIRNLGFNGKLTAFVNPCDWAAEMTRKDGEGRLLEMNRILEGITVVPVSEVDPGKYLIGDLSVYTLYLYDNFNTTYGYENDDFTRNLITIVAEARCFGLVSDNKRGALIYDDIYSVLALILKDNETNE